MFSRFSFLLLGLSIFFITNLSFADEQRKVLIELENLGSRYSTNNTRGYENTINSLKKEIEENVVPKKSKNKIQAFIAFQEANRTDLIYPLHTTFAKTASLKNQSLSTTITNFTGFSNNDEVASTFVGIVPENYSVAAYIRFINKMIKRIPGLNGRAYPNRTFKPQFIPNDTLYPNQEALSNLDAEKAWDITKGKGKTIGILDTGVNRHPDLVANIWVNPGEIPGNGIDDDSNGFPDDVNGYNLVDFDNDTQDVQGHGTKVAGVVAAVTDNNRGLAGACPECKVVPIRVGKKVSGLPSYDLITIKQGILYAVASNVDVLNISFGTENKEAGESLLDELSLYKGVIVAAAGNEASENPMYPAALNLDNLIAVTAFRNNGEPAPFSNFGDHILVGAPGASVQTLSFDDDYDQTSGTSVAAPFVSAAAALISSISSGEGKDIKNLLISKLKPADSRYSSSFNSEFGLLNLYDSVKGDQISDLKISGRITSQDIGVENVEVTLEIENGETKSVSTDEKGYYEFTTLSKNIEYAITPTKEGVNFTPPGVEGTLENSITHNFLADKFGVSNNEPRIIAGLIRNLQGIANTESAVRLRIFGANGEYLRDESTFVDDDGSFRFDGSNAVPINHFYLLTASKNEDKFSPAEYLKKVSSDDDIILVNHFTASDEIFSKIPTITEPIGVVEHKKDFSVKWDSSENSFNVKILTINEDPELSRITEEAESILEKEFILETITVTDWMVALVRVSDSSNESQSDVVFFRVDELKTKPNAPTPISPIGEDFLPSITFDWDASEGDNITYELELYNSENQLINQASGIEKTDLEFNQELPEGQYSWRVRAINEFGESDWSETSIFTVKKEDIIEDLDAPIITEPIGKIGDKSPLIVWEAVDRATKYEFYIENANNLEIVRVDDISELSYQIDELLEVGSYTLYVRAKNETQISEWSSEKFEILEDELNAPIITAPKGSIEDTSPLISWEAVERATNYEFYIESANIEILRTDNIEDLNYKINEVLEIGEYILYLRAKNDTLVSRWSTESFRVSKGDSDDDDGSDDDDNGNLRPPFFISPEYADVIEGPGLFRVIWDYGEANSARIYCQGPSGVIIDLEKTTDFSELITYVLLPGRYFCIGKSYFDNGESEWTERHYFDYKIGDNSDGGDDDDDDSNCPDLNTPNFSTPEIYSFKDSGDNLSFSWNSIENVTYTFRLYNSLSNTLIYEEENLSDNQLTISQESFSKDFYYAEVSAKSDCRETPFTSTPHEFYVLNGSDDSSGSLIPGGATPEILKPEKLPNSFTPMVRWTETFADYYEVVLLSPIGSEIIERTIVNDTSYRIKTTLEERLYGVYVIAYYTNDNTTKESEIKAFKASDDGSGEDDEEPLNVPQVITPVGVVDSQTPLFSWTNVGADTYQIELKDFEKNIIFNELIQDTSFIYNEELNEGNYSVKVRAIKSETTTEYGDERTFTIEKPGIKITSANYENGILSILTNRSNPLISPIINIEYKIRIFNPDNSIETFRTTDDADFSIKPNIALGEVRELEIVARDIYQTGASDFSEPFYLSIEGSGINDNDQIDQDNDIVDDDEESDNGNYEPNKDLRITSIEYAEDLLKINSNKKTSLGGFDYWVNNKDGKLFLENSDNPNLIKSIHLEVGTYTAWVRYGAYNGKTFPWSSKFTFEVKNNNSNVEVKAPSLLTTRYKFGELRFRASESEVVKYEFWLAEEIIPNRFAQVFTEETSGNIFTKKIDLKPNRYQGFVRGIFSNGQATPWSKPIFFETDEESRKELNNSNPYVNKPIAPKLIFPANNSSFTYMPNFSWEANNDATRYIFRLETENGITIEEKNAFSTFYTSRKNLIRGETYLFSVQTENRDGVLSDWSKKHSFTISN